MFNRVFRRFSEIALYIVLIFLIYNTMNSYDSNQEDSLHVFGPKIVKESGIIDPDEYNIMIDITESKLYLFRGDDLLKEYIVAHGKASSPSPIGVWKITNKARNWGSGFGSRWMGLNVPWGRYGIHGTNKPSSIGSMASAGCFRMHNRDVEELYDIVPSGTVVLVYGGPFGNLGTGLKELKPGARESHVVEVQKRLKILGYYNGAIDGIYGEGMKAAIINFKKDEGLPVSHTVDSATYKALGILLFE